MKKYVCSLDKNWFYTTGVPLGTGEACLSMDRVSNGKVGKAPPWDLVSVQAKLLYCCMSWLQHRYKQAWCMHTLRSIRAAVLFGSWIAQLDCLPSSWTKCDRTLPCWLPLCDVCIAVVLWSSGIHWSLLIFRIRIRTWFSDIFSSFFCLLLLR